MMTNTKMKAKAFSVGAAALVLAAVFTLTGCSPQAKLKGPDLTLKSLTIFGENAMGGSITVENAKTEVKASDVVAKFGYGTVNEEEIAVTVTGGMLNEGNNTVKLSIAAIAGKYKAWTKEITVTRKAAGTPAVNAVKMEPITLPASGEIVGSAPGVTFPSAQDYLKGVFIAGRKVKLSPFEMAESETTYALWKEVYGWATTHGYTFAKAGTKGSSGTGSDKEPVTEVSWWDVIVWCNAYTEMSDGNADNCVYLASAGGAVLRDATAKTDGINFDCDKAYFDKTKKGWRLPTEAEWEYAARAQTDGSLAPLNTLSGASGDYNDAETCKAVAWYSANSESKTHEVKKLKENGQKLYDMSGNVWEWCWDWHNNNVQAGDGGENPVTDPIGALSGADRVGRGGSWGNIAYGCLPGYRSLYLPDAALNFLGFRLCRFRS